MEIFVYIVLTLIFLIAIYCVLYLIFLKPFKNAKKRSPNSKVVGYFDFIVSIIFIISFIYIFKSMLVNSISYHCKSTQNHAKNDLVRIYDLQQTYFSKNKQYAQNIIDLGLTAENSRYAITLNEKTFELNKEEVEFNIEIPKNGFIAMAVNNTGRVTDGDPIPDVLLIDSNKALIHIVNDCRDESKYIDLNKYFSIADFQTKSFLKKAVLYQVLFSVFSVIVFIISHLRTKRS